MPTDNASNEHPAKLLFCIPLSLVTLLLFACSTGSPDNDTDSLSTSEEDQPTTADIIETNSPEVRILEQNVDGGPTLTDNIPNETAGIHLRQFYAWTNPAQARSDLASLSFTDGGDRSEWADVLTMEGGTLVALLPGLQTSSGVVNTDIESVTVNNEQLTLTVRTTVVGGCSVDAAFATPFRIAHVSAAAPDVLFREAIIPCTDNADADADAMDDTNISDVSVHFPDNATVQIDWVPPAVADSQTRYDVISSDGEGEIYKDVDQPTFTIDNLVPGLIYTRRIIPVGNDGDPLSAGTSIAVMVNAPSGIFRGRAIRDDLNELKSRLAGNNPTDCGEFTVFPVDIDSASLVSGCVNQAVEDEHAFTADRIFVGESSSFSSLVGDNMGNYWLVIQGNSDVILVNDFVPSAPVYGGYLTGQACDTPALNVDTGDLTCE